jgi:hypothetical protein
LYTLLDYLFHSNIPSTTTISPGHSSFFTTMDFTNSLDLEVFGDDFLANGFFDDGFLDDGSLFGDDNGLDTGGTIEELRLGASEGLNPDPVDMFTQSPDASSMSQQDPLQDIDWSSVPLDATVEELQDDASIGLSLHQSGGFQQPEECSPAQADQGVTDYDKMARAILQEAIPAPKTPERQTNSQEFSYGSAMFAPAFRTTTSQVVYNGESYTSGYTMGTTAQSSSPAANIPTPTPASKKKPRKPRAPAVKRSPAPTKVTKPRKPARKAGKAVPTERNMIELYAAKFTELSHEEKSRLLFPLLQGNDPLTGQKLAPAGSMASNAFDPKAYGFNSPSPNAPVTPEQAQQSNSSNTAALGFNTPARAASSSPEHAYTSSPLNPATYSSPSTDVTSPPRPEQENDSSAAAKYPNLGCQSSPATEAETTARVIEAQIAQLQAQLDATKSRPQAPKTALKRARAAEKPATTSKRVRAADKHDTTKRACSTTPTPLTVPQGPIQSMWGSGLTPEIRDNHYQHDALPTQGTSSFQAEESEVYDEQYSFENLFNLGGVDKPTTAAGQGQAQSMAPSNSSTFANTSSITANGQALDMSTFDFTTSANPSSYMNYKQAPGMSLFDASNPAGQDQGLIDFAPLEPLVNEFNASNTKYDDLPNDFSNGVSNPGNLSGNPNVNSTLISDPFIDEILDGMSKDPAQKVHMPTDPAVDYDIYTMGEDWVCPPPEVDMGTLRQREALEKRKMLDAQGRRR